MSLILDQLPASPVKDELAKIVSAKSITGGLDDLSRVQALKSLIASNKLRSLVPLLPVCFNLDGKPYTLENHFMFEPLFQTRIPNKLCLKTARQVGKSQSLAARNVLQCAAIPNFKTLFLAPRYDQVRRFSANYVRPLIELSPIHSMWANTTTENSVLQKSFTNNSKMQFSFALLDVDRVRGISTHSLGIDEVQDFDTAFLPVVEETLSASPYRLQMFAGTPKTLDNTMQGLWTASSQAEWCIPCRSCRKVNVPTMGLDLEKMIGPWHKNISREFPATICGACGHHLHIPDGAWIHRHEKRRWTFPGYHIPQILLPLHYAKPDSWSAILGKREGRGNFTISQFYNEVLGESYDVGTKLVNLTDLKKAACLPWSNNINGPPLEALANVRSYSQRVLAVDWGGGGEQGVSFTVLAVLGFRADGIIDVLWGKRSLLPHEHIREAAMILRVFHEFACDLLVHDYTGAGALRETVVIQAGIPVEQIVPIAYVGSTRQGILLHHPPTQVNPRSHYTCDKTRSLGLTCTAIKLGKVRFFQYDHEGADNPGLLHDFLALIEEKKESIAGSDLFTIRKNPSATDDFAQAVNIGCCALWQRMNAWPNIAEAMRFQMTPQQWKEIAPEPSPLAR